MSFRAHLTRSSVVVATLAISLSAACDGGASTSVASDEDYDEVATSMGALVADRQQGEVASMSEATLIAQGSIPPTFIFSGDIALGARLGVDISYTITCRDASDHTVACGDAASSARVQASWKGDWSSARVDASSDFKGDWSFTALGEPVVLMNGKAEAKIDVTVRSDASTRRWKLDYKSSYHDVGIDSDTRLTVSGTAHYDLKLERKVDGTTVDTQEKLSVKADVTFQADGTVTLLLDSKHKYKVSADGTVVLVARTSTG